MKSKFQARGKKKMRAVKRGRRPGRRPRIAGPRRPRKPELSLMNFKISEEDRRLFIDKAEKSTKGNVSALIIKAVKLASIQRLRRFY